METTTNNQIIEVKQADMLMALNKAEVDIQIATAKQYPRDVNAALNKISTYATMDKETAEDCFYVLRRRGNGGQDNVIEGLSIRMAEIIAGAWGNIRVQSRIIGNDGRMITAQAICHDLETNFAVSKEVKRRITDKNGRTFSEDMQVVTGNAAASIAFRNAVLAVIPKAVTKKVVNEVKKVALGQSIDLEQSRQNMLAYFKKLGVSEEQVLKYLGVKKINDVDKEKIFELRSTANAIKEGTTTVQEAFFQQTTEEEVQEEIEANANKEEISLEEEATQEVVDTETGEVTEVPSGAENNLKEEGAKKEKKSKQTELGI